MRCRSPDLAATYVRAAFGDKVAVRKPRSYADCYIVRALDNEPAVLCAGDLFRSIKSAQ